MTRYYCNCCGRDFTEEDSKKYNAILDCIVCPTCGAEREKDDDRFIEEYQK